ncbi:Ribosomal RNA small subunit methyltransferase D [Fundidesulfovibrio magnetotacticus]|uniref:Ribosomal RNA small subunit methyltransferase D n=1 Tax=Fundidesulfovibrio magnetotacticus TaxID=2730080 RepID=A0A6V8M2A1_9BACT|nr:16S rRNA (guanine(966)-N(2))-methyltransferase RsmD [Fundidesulfovibrio magnetotacticus]GFK94575.1 Ribosomal RNA small subunit methyltransferase D [Fundidesulfovibrio magnetotacticus]
MRILGGTFKGRDLPTLEGDGCRPAMAKVREALFNMLAARGVELDGARVLDVFAGTGTLGFESLSRGAAFVRFVEANKTLARRIAENARRLGLEPRRFNADTADALALLRKPPHAAYDLVFVDPPYGRDLLDPALALLEARGWLAPLAMVAVEVEKTLTPTPPASWTQETDRLYGQTRILLWTRNETTPPPSIPEPSTP